jgi:S1-C subfamily serine protease
VSDRRSGFPVIFQHDQPLKPSECGSILIDLHGAVIGVNVARDSRIGTYAIPAKTVAELLEGVDFPALEKVNETSPGDAGE